VSPVTRVARPPEKPVLIYDGECGFCRRWIARWRQCTGDRVEYATLQSDRVALQFPEIPRDSLETAVHLVEPDGRVTRGAEAAVRSQACARRWPLWLYENIPGVAPVTEAAYRVVARNRTFFSFVTRWLWGERVEPPTHFLVRWLFLRMLGVVYLIAFLSLNAQVLGLIGRDGIVPARDVMRTVEKNTEDLGLDRYRLAPTLCWFGTEDSDLQAQCVAGIVLAGLLILNVAPALCLALLWVLYLSLATVSTVFLGYQWDNLLLEVGLLAIFFAPLRLWPNLAREAPPPRIVLWLLRWLLFRLMFASGAVKLLSGDPTWHDLTALTLHYETQPLPTPLGWYAHQLPVWFQKASCAAMFVIELAVPFLIFLPRRVRFVAFWAFALLMLVISLTGNYTFFNLLTLALCVTLLDDFALVPFAPPKWEGRVAEGPRPPWLKRLPGPLRWAGCGVLALITTVVLTVTLVGTLMLAVALLPSEQPKRTFAGLLGPFEKLSRQVGSQVAPFRSINSYGLFAMMTTSRPEIIVEGSHDGVNWLPYEFPHKPGDIQRRPTFVAPHQPRLDWQMWFAALGDFRGNPWFQNFCVRLLQGKREVLALMEKNPFPDRPPRFIRASLYDYHFTTPEERRTTGAWWKRERKGEYCPPISLNRGPPQ
jgi:predicted DCC family thiol-disulfide oxidoreductase YuxK